MRAVTIYLDESGNSGDRLIDDTQPIFAFSAIGFQGSDIDRARSRLDAAKAAGNIVGELHTKRLLKRGKQEVAKNLLQMLVNERAFLFYSIVEKRFAVVGRIVDEFFDPMFNDNCDNSWTHPLPKRRNAADLLFRAISKEALAASGRFFRSGENVREVFGLLVRDLESSQKYQQLSEILVGAEPHLDELAEVIQQVSQGSVSLDAKKGVVGSPNFFSYCGLVNKVENFFRNREPRYAVDLVFDSSRQFNSAFASILQRLKKADPLKIYVPGSIPILYGFDTIRGLSICSSKDDILLQAADLVATSIQNVVRKVYDDDGSLQYGDFDYFVLVLIVSHWWRFGNVFCDIVVSGDLMAKIMTVLDDGLENFVKPRMAAGRNE